MKRLFLTIAMVLFLAAPSWAVLKSTVGDYNTTDSMYQLQLDGTTFTFAPSDTVVLPNNVTVPASTIMTFAPTSAIKYAYRVVTGTADTMTTADSGAYIVSTSTVGTKFTLPAAAVGLEFNIAYSSTATGGARYITVDTASVADTIMASFSSVPLDGGDSIKSSGNTGDSVCVISTAANVWSLCGMRGTFTDNGTN